MIKLVKPEGVPRPSEQCEPLSFAPRMQLCEGRPRRPAGGSIKTGINAALAFAAAALLCTLGTLNTAQAQAQATPTKCDPSMACCVSKEIGGDPKCAGASNPIDVITGNKYQREVDLPALPGVLGLEIVRHYNSVYSRTGSDTTNAIGILGRGWKLSYEIELRVSTNGVTVQIVLADGTPLNFTRGILNPKRFIAADLANGYLTPRETSHGREYVWHQLDGREYSFGVKGNLEQIKAPSGERVRLQYDLGQLITVTDPQGRSLDLQYLDRKTAKAGDRFRGVQYIDTPVGRFNYGYGSAKPAGSTIEPVQLLANLVKVTAPGPDEVHRASRIYHYENPHFPTLLTGLSISGTGSDGKAMHRRISTWAYDENGKANLSVKGEPARLQTDKDGKPLQPYRQVEGTGIEQVVLDHSRPGKTIAHNSLGQTTVFTYAEIAGRARLLEVRGAGCAHCAGPNVRYGYDSLGRLNETTQITADGQPIQASKSALDLEGRPHSVSRIEYRNGKAQPPQLLVRYSYEGSSPQPTVIARPSVVAGKEHIIRIAYNEAGQPTKITEEGFSPLDDKGQPGKEGTPISRGTTYSYTTISDRSVLTQIDGPLPNGPKNSPEDSDITRYEWDKEGSFVTAAVHPMNLREAFQYDKIYRDSGTGRLLEHIAADGVATRYAYNALGQTTSRQQVGADRALAGTFYKYDAMGRATEQLTLVAGQERPQSAQGFDVADRLLWQADRRGILRQARYDTEDHLLSSTVVGAGIHQEERYFYDALGHLERVEDNTGATHRLVHDAAGRVAAAIDSLGRVTEYVQDRDAHAWQVTQAANTGKPLSVRYGLDPAGQVNDVAAQASDGAGKPRSVTTRLLKDDFGQEVAVISPDSGTVLKRYDAAGRLIQIEDAVGTVTDIAYDAAGCMIRRTLTPRATRGPRAGGIPSQAAAPQTALFVYEGTRLVEVRHPQQSERYAYDEFGRVASKTVRLTLAADSQATSVTRYRYDEQGALVAQTLPDGSELQYERNGQGQIVALSRQTSAWAPFGWGRQTLVTGLERDLVGLRSATYGNGIVGQWQRSREGVLARVVYSSPARSTGVVRNAFESMVPDARAQAQTKVPPVAPSASSPLPGAFGLQPEPHALWDSRLLFDAAGNILVQGQFANSTVAYPVQTSYAYDGLNQLAQATHAGMPNVQARSVVDTVSADKGTVWRYHHDSLGNRLLAQEQQPSAEMGHTVKSSYGLSNSDRMAEQAMDEAGRPLADRERSYQWDAEGRLIQVSQPGKPTASYRYDHRGLRVSKQVGDTSEHYLYDERRQRLAELDGQGRITREYVWMGEQLIAVIDLQQLRAPEAPVDGFAQKLGSTARALWAYVTGNQPVLNYVHVNHLGAPVVMTNKNAQPVWSAEYAPFGKRIAGESHGGIMKTAAPGHVPQAGVQGIKLDLRLPGQWEDAESGLYYNDQRYYDPNKGRYLSPDPLGLQGGLNAYAYVNNNPMVFSDPLGLLLMAFDGTGNSDPAQSDASLSNVAKFYAAYDENANGGKFYITGIGTTNADMPYKGSMLSGDGFDQRVQLGFRKLEEFIDGDTGTTIIDIDTIGFSRGAAEARVWTNLLVKAMKDGAYTTKTGKSRCMNLRFEGLWDSVPHLGELHGDESKYDFGVPAQMKYVAHAVALNEQRGGLTDFNARSIFDTPGSGAPGRIELGFIGSHSDIGGGYTTGDLSDVALMWMIKQAGDQGIKFKEKTISDNGWNVVGNPILHDKSMNKWPAKDPGTDPPHEDRNFIYGNGTKVKQEKAVIGGHDTASARGYVDHYPMFCGPKEAPAVGVVDVTRYYNDWLKSQGVNISVTPPATAHPCK